MVERSQPSSGVPHQDYVWLPQIGTSTIGNNERVMLALVGGVCIFLPALCAALGAILSLGDRDLTHTYWAVGIGFGAVTVGVSQAAAIFWARSFVHRDWVILSGMLKARRFVITLAILAGSATFLSLVVGIVLDLGFVVTVFAVLGFMFTALPSITAVGRLHQVNKLCKQQGPGQPGQFQPHQF